MEKAKRKKEGEETPQRSPDYKHKNYRKVEHPWGCLGGGEEEKEGEGGGRGRGREGEGMRRGEGEEK